MITFAEQLEKAVEMGQRHAMSEGFMLGLRSAYLAALMDLYEARFGSVPRPLMAALVVTTDAVVQRGWVSLFGTGTREEIAEAVLGDKATR